MKNSPRILALALILLFSLSGFAQKKSSGVVHVKEYTKKNGTKVKAHDRTKPNKTQRDNWSSKPNVNPETGKKGTKTPKN